ncbi:S41 family peptidase [Rhodocytophaga rosea]|uniref:S41 family peptidase n=1 Tax=Rhodocytophaga rosea TaxID=2704465 RepID=A0A6C0GDY9_9BACT|nr:S41 family peptidase [Rhodocytophaga rosea]QHT65900.1 S41 family peptidase [Rhodocytophaga rosea]
MAYLKSVIFSVCFFMLLFLNEKVQAQEVEPKLNLQEMSLTIDSINNKLQENYIFPEVADKMVQGLNNNLTKGRYKSLVNPSEFARQLTTDLQSISHDKHLRIVYDPRVIAAEKNAVTKEDRKVLEGEWMMEMKRSNFGFQEIKILEGNIAYLDLREFIDTKYAGETAVAAMNFVSNADALIIDLRNNGGGSPSMIQLLTSYFFSAEPVHLNNFYFRPTNETTQTWTLPYVPGLRRPDMDLYVLTSNKTFSAAEEFSYNLKNLKRATLIGEKTGGGAHPTGSVIATNKFFVRVPKGRAINPITHTNWEGTGVSPHIEVSSDQAMKTAHARALENLKKKDE